MKEMNDRIRELTDQICRIYYSRVTFEQAIEEMQVQNVSAAFIKGLYEQLSMEVDNLMKRYRDNAEKGHYYSIEKEKLSQLLVIWTSRYLISYSRESLYSDFHEFTVFDSFNDKSLEMTVEKHAQELQLIKPLDDDFGLLLERGDGVSFISLFFLDLHAQTIQKLTTIERRCEFAQIIVNKADPTQFLLDFKIDGEWSIQVCKVVKTDIILGEIINHFFWQPNFYEKCIYGLDWIENENGTMAPQVFVYNVENKIAETFDLDLPFGYSFYKWKDVEWVRDCAIAQLESVNGQVVLAYGNVQTRQWSMIDFSLQSPIYDINCFQDEELIICTSKSDEDNVNFYKISLRKPDRLQNMAWLVLIKFMQKHKTLKGPYETARRYLPYNSAIRCPFAKPEKDEKTGPPQKLIKLK